MEPIAPIFFIEKILLDHLPDRRIQIKETFERHGFDKIVEQIITDISDLLHPSNKQETSPQEIAAHAYKAIKQINGRIIHFKDPEIKNQAKNSLSSFFIAVTKEIALKNPSLAEQLKKEIPDGLRIAARLEGYDEVDIFERIKLDDLSFPTASAEVYKQSQIDHVQPTRFKTILSKAELKLLGELLQQYGITRIKVQFENLFQNKKNPLTPVTCTNDKQLHFIHFIYCLITDFKWVSIENAGVWEGIKESFVDQEKNIFDKKIKQYYHRKIKTTAYKPLVIKQIDTLLGDFLSKFPDRKRTNSGR